MGQVLLGASPGGRPVAVKLVHPGLAADPRFRDRFKREVEAARRVGGFHTAPVVDADPDAETPWLVTAYVPGPSLAAAVAGHGPFPPASAQVLGAGLAEALEAVHGVGVVHREPDLAALPAVLREVVAGCLAKDPAARPAPGELLGALTAGRRPAGRLPSPVRDMLTRFPAHDAAVPARTAVLPPGVLPPGAEHAAFGPAAFGHPAPGPAADPAAGGTRPAGYRPPPPRPPAEPARIRGRTAPVVLSIAGSSLRLLVGLVFEALAWGALTAKADPAVAALFFLIAAGILAPAVASIAAQLTALRRPCELCVGPGGIELRYSGRRVRYHWHEIGRVVVRRRTEGAGWAVCVFPLPGTALPARRSPRTPLCYFEKRSGWIVIAPLRRLAGSRAEIERTLTRHTGPHWGGNA